MNCPRRKSSRAAFTLTELLISIGLALLLIIGVNAVFKTTGDTLSTGHAVATANRNEQSLQTVLAEDMRQLVLPEDAPFLLIRSRREAGFMDQAELDDDADYDATSTNANTVDQQIRSFDIDGDGTPQNVSPALYTRRNHRVDRIGFFARGSFAGQTGEDLLIDQMSANEAMIWYGHVKRPDNGGVHRGLGIDYEGNVRGRTFPLDPTAPLTRQNNPRNFFVSDWVLGRNVLLLAGGEDLGSPANGVDRVDDKNGDPLPAFFKRWTTETDGFATPWTAGESAQRLAPLSITSESNHAFGSRKDLYTSRYDTVATTMDRFRWMLAHQAVQNVPWAEGGYFDFRFQYDSEPARPLNAADAAYAVPALVHGCSQFIVEFAGDFITQSPDGVVTNNIPDGLTDFIRPFAGSDERRIRWYGMPRDTNGDNMIPGVPGQILNPQNNANDMVDVVPVAAVIMSAGAVPPGWFENVDTSVPPPADYATALGPNDTYIAAWGPGTAAHGKPQYIRFIIGTVPATSGGNERIAEFVFSVK